MLAIRRFLHFSYAVQPRYSAPAFNIIEPTNSGSKKFFVVIYMLVIEKNLGIEHDFDP